MSYVGLSCEYAVLNFESLRLKVDEENKFIKDYRESILFASENKIEGSQRLICIAKTLKVKRIYSW